MWLPVAIAYAGPRQIPDPHPQENLLIGNTPVTVGRPLGLGYTAYPSFTRPVADLQHLTVCP